MFKAIKFQLAIAALVASIFTGEISAQGSTADQPEMSIDAAVRKEVITALSIQLIRSYIFEDVARKVEADLNRRLVAGEYNSLTGASAFAEKLTSDLQALTKDKHLNIRFSPNPIPEVGPAAEPTTEQRSNRERWARSVNFGFEKIKRLPGNIGYIELMGFTDPVHAGETIRAAFAVVANTEAIIFDLRRNGGGSPEMVAKITSYLYGDKPVLLNTLYWREIDRTDEFWTDPKLPGAKLADKPIYILTSNRTFSAAEEFTYNLKNLKRATVVGETTGGGAHPGESRRLHAHFNAFIPTGRAISPITKSNWEGTGVEPDIQVPKEHALHAAQIAILKDMATKVTSEGEKRAIAGRIQVLEGEIGKMKVDSK